MSAALDSHISDSLIAARGSMERADDLMASLVAGLSLVIAMAADGNAELASVLCDRATERLYECVTANAENMRGHMRGAA